ncbi:hypothetical protein LSCM4_02527 [Leishmania orientalis]|uniref:Uncharacterized protein n=1 Tax=Leishmania orientalis TaxID=2249476 RepID=A0A836KFR6_9TRYP|nr:hypothetical protein LSCM4_02527 [Leishmania orientalis]
MPQKLTARQYTQVRCVLIIAHLSTFVFSLSMLLVAVAERRRYMDYFKIVTGPHRGANSSIGFMVASGAVGLVQPLLFFCIHLAYPLALQRQWAVPDDCEQRDTEAEKKQQVEQRPCALRAKSSAQRSTLFDLMDTSALAANGAHRRPPLSRIDIAAEEAPHETEAAAAVVSPAATAALRPSPPAQGLMHPRQRSLLLLKAPSDPPLSITQPPSTRCTDFFSSTPQGAPMVSRGSCTAAADIFTSAFSTPSSTEAGADMSSTATPLSRSPNVDPEGLEVESKGPVAAAVPSGHRLIGSCPAVNVPKDCFSTMADGAVFTRDEHEDATAAATMTAATAGYAEVSEGFPPVSDWAPPPPSEVSGVMTEPPGDFSTPDFGGKTSKPPRRWMPKTVTPGASATQVGVDGSSPAAAPADARDVTASRPDSAFPQSATGLCRPPPPTLVSSLGSPLTPLLHSVNPCGAGDTIRAQQDCAGILTVTPSKRSAMTTLTVAVTAAGSGASSTRDTRVAVQSSEEMQPPEVSAKGVRKGGPRHRSSSGDMSQGGLASALSKALPWCASSCATAEALPTRSHPARRPSDSSLRASARPLPPALLHMYFKSETTFRSLLTAYFTFAAIGILFMYFFGMLWLVRNELNGLNSLVSMADGWKKVFVYQKVTPAIDTSLCKAELEGRCSGGTHLCNATMYDSAEAAHNVSCPFCTPSQQRLISTFTVLCSAAYDPKVCYSTSFLALLALSVSTSLVSLCVAVFSCGTGVLASVGYATLSEREKEAREAQVLLDAGGLFSPPEHAPLSHSSNSPASTSPPLSHVAADETSSLTSQLVVAPSRERLMHTFEGLHAPSAALLPPLWTVMAEMSDSGDSSLVPPVSLV